MALINCPECENKVSDQAASCPHCGFALNKSNDDYEDINANARKCPKCNSANINYQREQNTSIGGGIHKLNRTSGHGCLYWLLFGWWVWIFKLMWEMLKFLCTCGLSLFFRKKSTKAADGHTISASKSFNRTMAVCQSCGHSWKV